MEQELEMDEERQMLFWRISAEQIEKDSLSRQMLEYNHICGVLPFDHYHIDDRICFQYSYSSLQPLEKCFERGKADYEKLYMILEEIVRVMTEGENYLLKPEGYLLQPQRVFWNRSERKIAVCYLPGRKKEKESDFRKLAEYLLEQVDHRDQRAVKLVYALYDMTLTEECRVEEIRDFLQGQTAEEQPAAGKGENGTEPAAQGEDMEGEGVTERKETVRIRFCPIIRLRNRCSMQSMILKMLTQYSFVVKEYFSVGSGEKNNLQLPLEGIGERHAEFFYQDHTLYLKDAGAVRGSCINAKKISAFKRVPCRDNDIISFADISFRIRIAAGDGCY